MKNVSSKAKLILMKKDCLYSVGLHQRRTSSINKYFSVFEKVGGIFSSFIFKPRVKFYNSTLDLSFEPRFKFLPGIP